MNDERPTNPPHDGETHSVEESITDPLVRSALVVEPAPPALRDRHLGAALAAFDERSSAAATPDTGTVEPPASTEVADLRPSATARRHRSRASRTFAVVAIAAALTVFGAIGVRALSSTNGEDSRAGSARTESSAHDSGQPAVPTEQRGSASGRANDNTVTTEASVELPAPSQAPVGSMPVAAGVADAASPGAASSLIDLGAKPGPTEISAAVASLGSPTGTGDLTVLGHCAASIRAGSRVIARATTPDGAVVVVRTPTLRDASSGLALITLSNCATRPL